VNAPVTRIPSAVRVAQALALHNAVCTTLGRHSRRSAGHRAAHRDLLAWRRAVGRLTDADVAAVWRGAATPLRGGGR